MNNEQAFNVIAQVVNAHLCNKQDRLVLDQAMQTIAKLVQSAAFPADGSAQPVGQPGPSGTTVLPPPTR